MKTLFFFVFVSIFSCVAGAATSSIFSADGRKATVFIQSNGGDKDVVNLFAALTAPIEVIDGKQTKRMGFDDNGGTRIFSIICILSAFVPENGTCTLTLKEGNGTFIDKSAGAAHFTTIDASDLARLVSSFVLPVEGDRIYSSQDGKLRLTLSLQKGIAKSFALTYQ